MSRYMLASQECLMLGGHCWNEDLVATFSPSNGTVRVCRHCGTKEVWQSSTSGRWVPATEGATS